MGKIRKNWIRNGLELYLKRLPGLTITELRESTPQKEEKTINLALQNNEILVSLTEEGEFLNSIEFAQRLQNFGSQKLAFLIGGADGIPSVIKQTSFWRLSLSPLTFPHEIARLLLVEQIYRAQSITQNSPYHRL